MSGDLSRIDWLSHDGVNLAMINDFMRNQFYDNIIKSNVKNRDVLDIGFGTGLLSILALQYGAKSVTAYESDIDRYLLGSNIIKDLRLGDKIDLINDRFHHRLLEKYKNHAIVTETVNGNLWQEGLFDSLPKSKKYSFFPNNYFLNVYAVEIPVTFAQGLGAEYEPSKFTPGLDFDSTFVNVVNHYYGAPEVTKRKELQTLELLSTHVNTEWGWIPHLRSVANADYAARYAVDVRKSNIWKDVQGKESVAPFGATDTITMELDVSTSRSLLIVPRVGMQHDKHKLFLDQGHWGPAFPSAIVTNYSGKVVITHDLHTGDITYELTH